MAHHDHREDTPSAGSYGSEEKKGHGAPRGKWIAYVGAVLIAMAALLQALGLEPFSVSQARRFLPSGFLPSAPKTIMLSVVSDRGGLAPLDVAMALRGLGKLNPSRIVILGNVNTDPDSRTLLDAIHGRLRENGIRVIVGSLPSEQSLWLPVPLCRYTPPAPLNLESPLPGIKGKVVPDGKQSFPSSYGEYLFPLLRITDSGDVAGSIWWEMLLPSEVTGPFWLVGGRLLLFQNHAPLILSEGALNVMPPLSPVRVVPMDLFLLRIEEKERGMLRPDFETLWEGATVVIGSAGDEGLLSRIAGIRENIAIGRLPPSVQAMIAAFLIIGLFASGRFPRSTTLGVAITLLILTIAGTPLALSQGVLLPYAPPLLAAILFMATIMRGVPR
jgi:hypothetical protein